MRFVNVGFNNIVNAARVVSVISSDSAPAKRLIQDARDMAEPSTAPAAERLAPFSSPTATT